MELMITLSIAGLFAYWIRRLKHEVWNLQKQVCAAAVGGPRSAARRVTLIPPHHAAAPHEAQAAPEADGDAQLNRKTPETDGGIPTWTLR